MEKANLPEDDDPAVELGSSDDSESEEFRREWDAFEKTEKQQATMSKYMKHDLNVSGRMNACKLVSNALHMNVETGDVGKTHRTVLRLESASNLALSLANQATQVMR